jgi:cytochrome c5
MSDANLPQNSPQIHDEPHEGPIKTPRQLMLAVFWAFVLPIALIVLLATYVTVYFRPAAGSDALTPQATALRIAPVGLVEVKDASDLTTLKTGDQVFAGQCTTCHTAGLVGAPKIGDADAWAPRIKTGYDALLHSALAGKGQMGPQGGGDYTDLEIGRAVVYMANKAGAKFEEPKVLPSGAAASAGAASAGVAAIPAGNSAASAPAGMAAAPAAAASTTAVTAATSVAAAPVAATPVAVAATADAAKPAAGGAAPALYAQVCQVCHAAGVAGAPKLGDKAAWAPRLAQGVDGLTGSAIKGKNAMPPRGGSTASDAEIKAVVAYMVSTVK